MRYCPTCQATFDGEEVFCPHDGTRLLSEQAHQPGRLAGSSLAGTVNLEAFLFADHLGERYRGRLLLDNREVRVVVLHRRFDAQRIQAALDSMASLRSPLPHQILETHSLHLDSEPHFLIEEQPERETLEHLLKKKSTLPWKQALFLAIRLARILDWLTEQGVPHQAIHPRSIYVDNPLTSSIQIGELAVGLLAFPLPKIEDATPLDALPIYPGFIAPEWLDENRDAELSHTAGYTVGAVLLNALGHSIIDAESLDGMGLKKWATSTEQERIDLSDLLDAPPLLEELANMLVAPLPKKRFQSPAAAMAALANLADETLDEIAPPLMAREQPVFREQKRDEDHPLTGAVPFPDHEESTPDESEEAASVGMTQLGFTPKAAASKTKTQMGLPAQALTQTHDDETEDNSSASAQRVIIDDPGDLDDEEKEKVGRNTARFTSDEQSVEPVRENQDSDSHTSTLLMGAISAEDIAAERAKNNGDEETPEDGDESTEPESEPEESEQEEASSETQRPHAVEAPEKKKQKEPREDEPSIIIDSHEPEPSIIIDQGEEPAPEDSVEDDQDESSSANEMNIGFVEARQNTKDEFSNGDWFSRSTEDAWDDTLVREAYEKSRWSEKAVRIGLMVGLVVFVAGVAIFTQLYDPVIEEEEEERVEEFIPEPEFNVERTLDQFDHALDRGELILPRQRSALAALRDLNTYADEAVYDEARARFVDATDAASYIADHNGNLPLARNLSGYASQYEPDDEDLRTRAEEIQARYVAELEGESADPGADAGGADTALDNEIETATPTPTRAPRRNTDSQPATDPDALFRSAESARRSNDFEQARRLYLQFLEQSPNHAAANAHLARIYFDEDADHRTALQYQRRAVEAAPGNINHRLQLGMLHYRLTQYQEAIDVWEKVLEVEPNNTDAQRWIGLAEGSMN